MQLLVFRCLVFVGVCVEFVAAVAWLAELFPDREQREKVLGYTQAFSSFGGLLVGAMNVLAAKVALDLPAIHGGVLGAFLEMTALAQLAYSQGPGRQPRAIDVTVQYLRSGKPMDTYARARMNRVGRRIANIYAEAWQETRGSPIATLHGHFLLVDAKDDQ